MASSLQVLAKNRDALLLAEVAAWLHMFGKFHEDFLKGLPDTDIKIPGDVQSQYQGLSNLLTDSGWTGSVWGKLPIQNELRAKGISIEALIRRHRPPNPKQEGLVKLMQDAHGRGSGIEKGTEVFLDLAPKNANRNPTYTATSFGFENEIDEKKIQRDRNTLYGFLQKQLSSLQIQLSNLRKNEQLDVPKWLDFRSRFIAKIRGFYLDSVAETRRPANDVTLFDQTSASVAFFKAALAQILLVGWKEPLPNAIQDKYRWRLLRVGLDGIEFWANAVRIGDLLSRKELVTQTLDQIQDFLEVTYPLGFEIYRDEYGSIFIVPDIGDLLDYTDSGQSIQQYIQTVAQQASDGEATFTLSPSKSTRDTLSFGELVASMLPQPTPGVTWLQQKWLQKREDICPVCGCRPQGPDKKALARKVCNICEHRRANRSEEWIKNPATTIWIDEVADKHGQVVLLVARFSIMSWLSGTSFNSMLVFDPKSRSLDNDPRHNFGISILDKDIRQGLAPGQQFEDNLLGYLVSDKNLRGSGEILDLYKLLVSDSDLGGLLSVPHPNISQSELLALALLRQYPAFARISRVWRTTEDFWEKISDAFHTTIGPVSCRLRIQGSFNADQLGISHSYELQLGGINLSIVYTKEGEFLAVDNLQRTAILLNAPDESRDDYLSAASYVQRYLLQNQGRIFEIQEPTGYGSPNRTLGQLRIEDVTFDQTPYVPAITVLAEPRTFMAFVPADKALEVAKAIKKKYDDEIGRVRNRLPLTVGIIFAGRRTPLPAILDAGRRMLKQPTEDNEWEVTNVDPLPRSSWPSEIKLTLRRSEQDVVVTVKTVMGDTKTEDVWYPYWCLKEGTENLFPRDRKFKGINGRYWTHVCDLQIGDAVSFMPSRLDFEFLDTASRRFEISYKDGKRRGHVHPARPYYLEQLGDLERLWEILSDKEKGLATSQIDNLVGLIEAKRKEWLTDQDNPVFRKIVSDIVANAGWKARPDKEDRERLIQAALSGQLADVFELHMTILKEGGNE